MFSFLFATPVIAFVSLPASTHGLRDGANTYFCLRLQGFFEQSNVSLRQHTGLVGYNDFLI